MDLSYLSPEKRMLVKANPELLRVLQATGNKAFIQAAAKEDIPLQSFKEQFDPELRRQFERNKRRFDEMRRQGRNKVSLLISQRRQWQHTIHAEAFERALKQNVTRGPNTLVCPVCGEGDKGNRRNKKPYCVFCRETLIPLKKLKSWKPIKVVK